MGEHNIKKRLAPLFLSSLMLGSGSRWYPPLTDYKEKPSGLKGHSWGHGHYRPTTASDRRHTRKMILKRRKQNKAAKKARRRNR